MKANGKISAYILPTVLVIGTLMLLAVLLLFNLWESESQFFHGNRIKKQRKAWLESALLLWETDSSFMDRLDYSGTLTVFNDDSLSAVNIQLQRWGLYELVKLTTADLKERLAAIAGSASSSGFDATLYVCNNDRAFSLAGTTDIKGKLYLPVNGIEYGRVLSDYYSGRPVPFADIYTSGTDFPEFFAGSLDSVKLSVSSAMSSVPADSFDKHISFFNPTVFIYAGNLGGYSLSGNIVVCSNDRVIIDSTCRLRDIIVIAPKITVKEGFRGSLQIIATDSVVVEPGAKMDYPSGILMYDTHQDSFLCISDSCALDGYAIFRLGDDIDQSKRTPNYLQMPGSRIRGMVWTDGIAQVQGTVMGALYVNYAAYFAEHGYYTGILYNTTVYGSHEMAFPLWMTGDYCKKIIKWVD